MENKELETKALSWPTRAKELTITDQSSYEMAANTLKDIALLEKQIKDHHKPIKDSAYAAHKAAVAAEKRLLDPLDEAKRTIKRSVSDWTVEQERIRAEAQRKIDEANRAAEKAAEDARLEAAIKAEKDGAPDIVTDAMIDIPFQSIYSPPAHPTYNKVAGVTTRETWKAEVFDVVILCKAIGDGTIKMTDVVVPNMTVLNSLARSMKDKMSIPGVRAVKEISTAVRV